MITDPKIRKRRVRKLVHRFGGGTKETTAEHDLLESTFWDIPEEFRLERGEEPLLVSSPGKSEWCLLTTERLIWREAKSIQALFWRDVRGAQQPPEASAMVIRGLLPKDAVDRLEVFNSDDDKFTLRLEPGKGYYLIWSGIISGAESSLCAIVLGLLMRSIWRREELLPSYNS